MGNMARKIGYELGPYEVVCESKPDGSWIATTGRTGNAIGSSSDAAIAESLLRIADLLEEDAARVQEEANEIRVNVRAAFGRDPEANHVKYQPFLEAKRNG